MTLAERCVSSVTERHTCKHYPLYTYMYMYVCTHEKSVQCTCTYMYMYVHVCTYLYYTYTCTCTIIILYDIVPTYNTCIYVSLLLHTPCICMQIRRTYVRCTWVYHIHVLTCTYYTYIYMYTCTCMDSGYHYHMCHAPSIRLSDPLTAAFSSSHAQTTDRLGHLQQGKG